MLEFDEQTKTFAFCGEGEITKNSAKSTHLVTHVSQDNGLLKTSATRTHLVI